MLNLEAHVMSGKTYGASWGHFCTIFYHEKFRVQCSNGLVMLEKICHASLRHLFALKHNTFVSKMFHGYMYT